MTAVNYSTLRDNLKRYCDMVTDEQETVIVTRKEEKNVVLLSLAEWNAMQKALRNAAYLEKLQRSVEQVERGELIGKTLAELEAMEHA